MNKNILGTNDGKDNEHLIINAINDKKLCDIADGPQAFLRDTKDTITDDSIFCAVPSMYGMKPDIEISEKGFNTEWYVSIKKGKNNSVHQEKIDYLVQYCTEELNMSDKERDCLLLYAYGDGTLDGNTTPDKWLSEDEVQKRFSNEILILQNFINKNKRALLERFLVYGRLGKVNKIKANYIYHGTPESGNWCKLNAPTIDYLLSMEDGQAPCIGPFNIKSWGRGSARNRQSLQVMWSSCENDLKTIHDLHLQDIADEEEIRIVGDNSHGFENQNDFCNLINNKRFKQLPTFVRNIIKTLFPNIAETEYIYATKRNNYSTKGYKNSIDISVNGEKKSISVHTTDQGISGHQEKLDDFLTFCRETLDLTSTEERLFRYLHYGDGTLDGSGDIEDRKDNDYLKKNHADYIKIVQAFIDRNERALLERILMYGKNGKKDNVKVDYIYIGTANNGILASVEDIIENIIATNIVRPNSYLRLCDFTVQTYRRNIHGSPTQEKYRHDIQFKVGSIGQAIENIKKNSSNNLGTIEGDIEEYALVKKLNSNKNSTLWKPIMENLALTSVDDIYAVKVLKLLPSEISKAKVKPKADIFLIRANIPHHHLLRYNYWLDEETVSEIPFQRLDKSGISVKRPDSKHFNYMKFTINTFNKIFNNPFLGAGICLYAEKNLNLNEMIINKWDLSLADFVSYFSTLNENISESSILNNYDICSQIKRHSIDTIKDVIKTNQQIAEYIFMGKGAFEEPYTANFTYINSIIDKTDISPNFTISTGSGRHSGKITIIITP